MLCRFTLVFTLATLVTGCASAGDDEESDAGAARDPCEDMSQVFCLDRVDDDCDGIDEPCPSTQPADIAPTWDCTTDAPVNVLASATFGSNAQVASGCVFVYQGETGAYYAAVDIVDGPEPRGPPGISQGRCAFDTGARKHLFFTTSPIASCDDVEYVYPEQPANQHLSNACRKMVRNIRQDDPRYDPDIQFLPGDRAAQEARMATFDVAEVACIGIIGRDGEPIREDEGFVSQASAAFTMHAGFEER
jgi:hypothetical protein